MKETYEKLKTRLAEVSDLSRIGGLLGWDQRTMMAPRAAAGRAEQIATLARLIVERFVDPEIGRLLDQLRDYEGSLPFDSDEASLIRVTRQDFEKASRVPPELHAEMARGAALAQQEWARAREESDYSLFLPHLEKMVALKHRYIECLQDEGMDPYDVLLDDFERGMKTAEVETVFRALKEDLVPLIAQIREREDTVSDSVLYGHFPIETQKRFTWELLGFLGADSESWRLDPTVHPFASNGGREDIRLTTRFYEHYLCPSLFSTMHEFGHGLYEHQVAPELDRTPLCRGTSLGIHESQSRLWENLVGRSRAFWGFAYPKLQEAYPDRFRSVPLDDFYRAINMVKPSCIRVEADEATYSLHIILRFEMERGIIAGSIALKDVPEAWSARFKELFGIEVADDAQGVLQDVHWSSGYFGYFPTYALGSIIASQFWEKTKTEIPDIDDQFSRGEFGELRDWLRERIHRHGRKFTPAETLKRVAGGPIDVAPFIRYLKGKFGRIYRL